MLRRTVQFCFVLLTALASGCAPLAAVNIGMYAVGKVVDDQETQKLAGRLMGQPPSAANEALGTRIDTFRDVNSSRRWITYPVKMNLPSLQRYVVEVAGNQIVAVEMTQVPTGQVDIARAVAYEAIVQGQSPRSCEQKLGGPPALTLRSEKAGQLVQLYNGQLVKDVGDQKYIVLRFGPDGLCHKCERVDVMASSNKPPAS